MYNISDMNTYFLIIASSNFALPLSYNSAHSIPKFEVFDPISLSILAKLYNSELVVKIHSWHDGPCKHKDFCYLWKR